MSRKPSSSEYEPVVRLRRSSWWENEAEQEADWTVRPAAVTGDESEPVLDEHPAPAPRPPKKAKQPLGILKRGHTLSYLGLFLFTLVVYFRPYELIPALSSLTSLAFWLAVLTALIFIPTQLGIEGTLTARPREVNLALLLCLCGLLSIPLAIEPGLAWDKFVDFIKVIFMFIVMVNVVRTERRLKWLLLLALAVSLILSVDAINDYRLGRFSLKGERIEGMIANLFDNPNDLALHLGTMVPIALGLFFMSRAFIKKIFYGVGALLMALAIIFTFSRGGFLALVAVAFVLAWKLGRRSRLAIVGLFLFLAVTFFALAPGSYTGRVASIFNNNLDTSGSATSRQTLLLQSLKVTVRHPLLGIGMNNFPLVSARDQVSHNAYTQIGAEMGVPAMLIYVLLIVAAIKRLRNVERETYEQRRTSRHYYLAIGLQASLIGYMVSSFFASVAYLWYIYYLVGYALCLHRLHEASREAAGPAEVSATELLTTANAKVQDRAASLYEPPVMAKRGRQWVSE